MTYKPPQADSAESQDHVCTLQSCHGAAVAPLSEVPKEGSSVFSLFSLIKLHLASLPLASSYSHVAVSSVFCAQNIFFGPNAWGLVKVPQERRCSWGRPLFRVTGVLGSIGFLGVEKDGHSGRGGVRGTRTVIPRVWNVACFM